MAYTHTVQRRPRLWLILAVLCVLVAVFWAVDANYFYTAIFAVLAVGLASRAWEERERP
jgi:hypothetical protein